MEKFTYYIVFTYSSFWKDVTEGAIVSLDNSLDSTAGINEACSTLRKENPDAVLLNWKRLD